MVATGQAPQTVEQTVEQVSGGLVIDSDMESFDERAFLRELAAAYNVPTSYLKLSVAAGSLRVRILMRMPFKSIRPPMNQLHVLDR